MRFYADIELKGQDNKKRVLVRALSHRHAYRKIDKMYKGQQGSVQTRLGNEVRCQESYERVVQR